MILSTREMRDLEAKAFASGHTAESLMEEAGLAMSRAIRQFFPAPGSALVYYGKGHNGGDALVAARHLAAAGWSVELRAAFSESDLAELTRKKLGEAGSHGKTIPGEHRTSIILDGLLGIGVTGPLREPIRQIARDINTLRMESGAAVFAIDLPSGLDSDTGAADPDCVRADFTLTVGAGKSGLVAEEAANFVGRICVLPVEGLAGSEPGADDLATARSLGGLLRRRDYDSHKGDYGRIGIVAGSEGFTGAAIMTATGALKAGGGLVSLYVTPEIYSIVAATAPPEVMVHAIKSYRDLLSARHDVLAIGPGLGDRRREEVLDLVRGFPKPMVLDADALNLISASPSLLKGCAGARLLTPHPGEMARLFPVKEMTRREIAKAFTARYPVALLLKGARTIVAESGRAISFNTTGNPGMATGGMGDVLTGVCAALLGSGLGVYDAGRLGAWLCGRAAEIAIYEGNASEESLTATELFLTLGRAFHSLRCGEF